jgi:hypothetical protein
MPDGLPERRPDHRGYHPAAARECVRNDESRRFFVSLDAMLGDEHGLDLVETFRFPAPLKFQ